jgi:hypothetical protein
MTLQPVIGAAGFGQHVTLPPLVWRRTTCTRRPVPIAKSVLFGLLIKNSLICFGQLA